MKMTLSGIELDLPEGAVIEVSEDGKRVKITFPAPKVIERIRVVEVQSPYTFSAPNNQSFSFQPPIHSPQTQISWSIPSVTSSLIR